MISKIEYVKAYKNKTMRTLTYNLLQFADINLFTPKFNIFITIILIVWSIMAVLFVKLLIKRLIHYYKLEPTKSWVLKQFIINFVSVVLLGFIFKKYDCEAS